MPVFLLVNWTRFPFCEGLKGGMAFAHALGDLPANLANHQRVPGAKSGRAQSMSGAVGAAQDVDEHVLPRQGSASCMPVSVPLHQKPYRSDLEVPDCVEQIWRNDKKAEVKHRPPLDYMEKTQVEVTADMRGICLDWIIECANRLKMEMPTIFLAAHVLDSFLSKKAIRRERMQMVSMVSLIVAAKYEEIYPPRIKDYIHISANSFKREDMLRYEHYILHALNYSLTVPTPYHFLTRYCYALKEQGRPENREERETRHAACFISECALLKLQLYLDVKPSLLAAGSMYAGRQVLGLVPWPSQVSAVCEHSEVTVAECAKKLLAHARTIKDGKLKATMNRYREDSRSGVSRKL